MLSTLFLLLAFSSISSSNFYCPKYLPCLCTTSFVALREYHINCLVDKSVETGLNAAMHLSKYVNVECQNAPDWTYFLPDSNLGVRRLKFSGCEFPSGVYFEQIVDRLISDGLVEFWEVKKLKTRVSKQFLDGFPSLKTLVLSNNYLGQVDEDLLYGQRNLTKLELSATQIQIPPGFFVKSSFLKHLDLSNNDLHNLEPGIFDGLENLRTLILSHNNFKVLLPGQLRGLTLLSYLDISHSGIYAIADPLFEDTVNLKFVDLSDNRFFSISWIRYSHGLDRLKVVRLERNKFSMTELPSRLFSNLSSLRLVSLEGLGLLRLSKELFWKSTNIMELNLSQNELEELPVDLLWDASELRKFNASSNKLRAVPDGFFAQANKLTKLDLSKNRITTLGSHFADGLRFQLQIIPKKAFSRASRLRAVKLARKRLSLLSHFSEKMISPFRHCMFLKQLDLSHNGIAKIFVDWLDMGNLRKLDLSHNNFTGIGVKDLQFTSRTDTPEGLSVDLSHNKITSVNVSLSHLRHSRNITINLNDNPIDCNCEVYALRHYAAECSTFKHVNLLTSDSPKCSLRNNATHKCFSKLCASEGANCDCWIANRTVMIDCARRNLTEAPSWIGTWGDLHVSLDLSGNLLTEVPLMTRNGYHRVRSLNLADNRIARIGHNLVSPGLRHLHLERNRLTSIKVDVVLNLTRSVEFVWLAGNPWLCDGSTWKFRRLGNYYYKLGDKIGDHKDVTCHNSQEPFWGNTVAVPYSFGRFVVDIYNMIFGKLICLYNFLLIVLYLTNVYPSTVLIFTKCV